MAITTSPESQVIQSLNVFATSSFSSHSLISTVYVVQNIINAIIKPPTAIIANVFGRLHAYCLSITLLTLGYAQMASSKNVQTFAAAQVFYSAGSTGLQILNQIFVADTTSLENRAILSVLPCVPFMINVWIGGVIGERILKAWRWRWGYGVWCIVLPLMFLPCGGTMWWNGRKVAKKSLTSQSHFMRMHAGEIVKACGMSLMWVGRCC